ncbi:hypothetical protein HYDPIDRAFT_28679 [Hydnomerulius pinastri MD-312]|uniref:Uncharacterized protein n=1 Tax=Hydnomerulius pinastri MD-312 TaxID=994086 RepID=A0A0C9W0G8_9AGAM|nr:hypothetical protein HYDPIDRAFT_28679 [Hydnomerulius pinastri MD-312]
MSTSASINPLTGTDIPPINLSYTALVATLVLLLAVSSAIVIRSLVLRRRHQRLVEEAIRAGTWVPHQYDPRNGRRRRDIGEKPKMWEAWLQSGDDEGSSGNEKGKWDDIMPVYAAHVDHSPSSSQVKPPGSSEDAAEPQSRPSRFLRPFSRRPSPPSPHPVTGSQIAVQAPSSSSSPTRSPSPAVRVAVLIAMPSPPQQHNRDEDGPPIVELGVVEVGLKDDGNESPSRDDP